MIGDLVVSVRVQTLAENLEKAKISDGVACGSELHMIYLFDTEDERTTEELCLM